MQSFQTTPHNHIVAILGHGSLGLHTASYFIDMEYCDLSLEQYLRGQGSSVNNLLDYETANHDGHLSLFTCAIMQELLSGLIFIHMHDKVHRDLKPANSKTPSRPRFNY
jgi:serine/threonine protein kinase